MPNENRILIDSLLALAESLPPHPEDGERSDAAELLYQMASALMLLPGERANIAMSFASCALATEIYQANQRLHNDDSRWKREKQLLRAERQSREEVESVA